MPTLQVGTVSLNQTPMDWEGNFDRIREAIRQAEQQACSLVLFPEMCISGYGCEDWFLSQDFQRTCLQYLHKIAAGVPTGMCVVVGVPFSYRNALFNCAAVLTRSRIHGLVPKRNLAGDGLHYEPRWFREWPEGVSSYAPTDYESVPIGDLVFDLGKDSPNSVRFGFEICEDAWVANRPGGQLAKAGVDIILNPSASHFSFGKAGTRARLVSEGSRAFGCSYLYANLLGNEAGRAIYDGGSLIASAGEIVAAGECFSYQDVLLTTAVLDIGRTRTRQSSTASFDPNLDSYRERTVGLPIFVDLEKNHPVTAPLKGMPQISKLEEFEQAVALGLFDYMRKARTHGFVISLSGGADSTACAVLVRQMVSKAVQELGFSGFALKSRVPKLIHWVADTPAEELTVEAAVSMLLTTVYQGTENSSETTRAAAETVAGNLGASFHDFNVGPLVAAYEQLGEAALGRPLSWEEDDIARQNIQARVRAPGAWLLANLGNQLLISTSNRSEAAVGYATMDGDTCGGIAPIAGIDKDFLRKWLRHKENTGMSFLSCVTTQQPTAELRPLDSHGQAAQSDEEDLMPYPVLDLIEKTAIRDKKGPAECFVRLQDFPGVSAETRFRWVQRFFTLWARNQWKRERYAPSFHLDDENLDPKTWCRFPILSGGYAHELQALERQIDNGLI